MLEACILKSGDHHNDDDDDDDWTEWHAKIARSCLTRNWLLRSSNTSNKKHCTNRQQATGNWQPATSTSEKCQHNDVLVKLGQPVRISAMKNGLELGACDYILLTAPMPRTKVRWNWKEVGIMLVSACSCCCCGALVASWCSSRFYCCSCCCWRGSTSECTFNSLRNVANLCCRKCGIYVRWVLKIDTK